MPRATIRLAATKNLLVLSFILVAMFSVAIGFVAITRLSLLQQSGTAMYELNAVPLSDLIDVSTFYQKQRVNLQRYGHRQDQRRQDQTLPDGAKEFDQRVDGTLKKVTDASKS